MKKTQFFHYKWEIPLQICVRIPSVSWAIVIAVVAAPKPSSAEMPIDSNPQNTLHEVFGQPSNKVCGRRVQGGLYTPRLIVI